MLHCTADKVCEQVSLSAMTVNRACNAIARDSGVTAELQCDMDWCHPDVIMTSRLRHATARTVANHRTQLLHVNPVIMLMWRQFICCSNFRSSTRNGDCAPPSTSPACLPVFCAPPPSLTEPSDSHGNSQFASFKFHPWRPCGLLTFIILQRFTASPRQPRYEASYTHFSYCGNLFL